ncbi:bifunctional acetate--CoA ligase family protein/GNAT family N-acetyltransferase [Sessilibacter corallicola]|uniref:GNAT family N-acetyltransferase n=1 Tax=Sessilibacter corallicola TaxID=2904075 RepID=A0ABQ0AB60_9GAMM
MAQHALQPLFAPTSVVVLTGEDPSHPLMIAVLKSLEYGAQRRPTVLVGVEPEWKVGNLPFEHIPTFDELAQPCELAILAGLSSAPLDVTIEQCAKAGVKSILMLTWTDRRPSEVRAMLKRHGIRLLGPSSFGNCRPKNGFLAWLGMTPPLPGRLALMSQSGSIASAIVDWASWQGIGFSQVTALGNPVDVMPWEVLDYLSTDFESQSILIYLKRIGHTAHFLSSLRAASRAKPVAVVAEHAIGADERVLDAALNRTGAVRGRRLNDLVAAASVMTNARRIKDGSLLVIGNGSGPGELAAQRATELGVSLLTPTGQLHEHLEHVIADRGHVGEVTTVWASSASDLFVELAGSALKYKECGAVLLMLSPTALLDIERLFEQVEELHSKQRKLVMVCLLGGGNIVSVRTRLNEAGIPTFRTPETAIEGYQFLVHFQRNQRLAKQSPESLAVGLEIGVDFARKQLLQLIENKVNPAKTDDLVKVFQTFSIRLHPALDIQNYHQIPIHVRVFRDPVFGPAIGLSVGGSDIGRQQSEVVGLPPLNSVLAKDLIAQLFTDFDSKMLENLLLNISTMICELPEIQSLDLENVSFFNDGRVHAGVSACLNICPGYRRYEHLAIQPYPRQWVTELVLRDGRTAVVRPVLPSDSYMMSEFVRGLSHETRYFRFIANFSELTAKMLSRFVNVDYDREMALLAVMEENGETIQIGAARYSDNFDGISCEFAVVLGDGFQGQGLAAYLMRRLILVANDKGIRVMRGTVLAENKHMIEFCRGIGFSICRDPEDLSLVIAEVRLTEKFVAGVEAKLSKVDHRLMNAVS